MFLDDAGDLKIGDLLDVKINGAKANAALKCIITGRRDERYREYGVFTVEILDFGEDKEEYWQILFDRIPSLPMTLQNDDNALFHLLRNIRMRL